ncbi:YheC/YheD family protein [Evansella clarkii]|jgi:glutathione synthase/RimK-type ligase-like ATP-grasp enzyme|uniref:YheC/YheD family endospore coat-associated protein n=1 Tax=Evansella clarkii TaxID=79879 RepID=UPI0009989D5E|nr:YheC/YheD family protein [Evansella clarkii]
MAANHNNPEERNIIILTGQGKDRKFTGETRFYEQLAETARKRRGKVYILPFRGGEAADGKAFSWDMERKEWVETSCPEPDVVYNRFSDRFTEWADPVQQYFNELEKEKIPYFNRCFFNKLHTSSLLQNHRVLKKYYPETKRMATRDDLAAFLNKHNAVFIKDIHGSQGQGIWKVENNGTSYTLQTQKQQYKGLSFQNLAELLKPVYKKKTLLIQEGIPLTLLNDRTYDFRVLVHFFAGKWHVTGIGVRQARNGGYTTHVPQGGRILSFDSVPVKPDPETVKQLSAHIGKMLDLKFQNVREFSFDLGTDDEGGLWILDVNSKPMMFDEREINKKRINTLARIFAEA